MRNKREQQRAHEKKTYKHKCAMHAKDKTRARQKSKPKPAQQANARARGNKACEECDKLEVMIYECNLCKKNMAHKMLQERRITMERGHCKRIEFQTM
jgi:hypothetical protein